MHTLYLCGGNIIITKKVFRKIVFFMVNVSSCFAENEPPAHFVDFKGASDGGKFFLHHSHFCAL